MKDRFFVYCNESGFELFETLDDALDAANERIQGYLEDAWSDEVASVCAGKITHRAKMCDQVFPDGEIDEEGLDESGELWDPDCEYKCNYKMLSVKKQSPDHLDDAPELDQEPVAWIINHSDWSSSEPVLKKNIAERYELDQPGCTIPLYPHPQPDPEVAKLVEALEQLREPINMASMEYDGGYDKYVDLIDAILAAHRQQVGAS